MALVFGFEVNLLEIMVLLALALFAVLLGLLFEVRKLKQLIDEALRIEKMHSQERERR